MTTIGACQVALTPATATPEAAAAAREALGRAKLEYLARQVPRAIAQSLEGLQRIGHLVAAMKEFSHPSAGTKVEADLNAMIETTITIAHNEWKYVAEVHRELSPTLPRVRCLGDEVSQVVLNLLVNAAQAIAERARERPGLGHITIRTWADGDDAVIQMTDDGCGIPEAIRHRIFEPFFTTKPVGKGTGQGLAISYDVIMEKHHGRLEVESEVGVGTTFTIRLPLAP
jgi:signal transduction histidine kinase